MLGDARHPRFVADVAGHADDMGVLSGLARHGDKGRLPRQPALGKVELALILQEGMCLEADAKVGLEAVGDRLDQAFVRGEAA
jgi:hypothetical protein